MQQLPRTISNPLIGDQVTFLKTSADTGGAYTLVEVVLAPGGSNGLHYHNTYTEVFEVCEGTLGVQLGKEVVHLRKGERATIPLQLPHRFFNASNEDTVTFRVTVAPASRFEQMLRIAYGLANDGKTNKKGLPGIWHLALMFEIGESYLPGIPLRLQKGIFGFLARIARRKGKDKELLRYYMPAAEAIAQGLAAA